MKVHRTASRFTSLLAVTLALSAPQVWAAETLTYEGATTIGNKIIKEASAAFEKKGGVKFDDIITTGSAQGFKAAMAGEVSVGGVARALTPDELAAKPGQVIVGYDAIGVFVNDANPVKVLTKAQLKAIFTGSAKNWKEVGGSDLPIVTCTEPPKSGRATVDTFKAVIMDGQGYGRVTERNDASDCVKLAAKEPGVIGPASLAYTLAGARAIPVDGVKPTPADIRSGAYLLSRQLVLVTKGTPSGVVKAFFDFMVSEDGQKVVAKNFVTLK
jgi:phosphate transport system substrate-binding protein